MRLAEVLGREPSKQDKAVALELQQELIDYDYEVELSTVRRDGYPGVGLHATKGSRGFALTVFNGLIYMPGVQGNFDSVENTLQNLKTYFAVSGKEL